MTARGVPTALATIEAELVAPGGLFALEETEVRGQRMVAFSGRLHSLREAVVTSQALGDAEYLVFREGDGRRTLTFGQHARAVASVAAALRDRHGIRPGDRVAILAANSPEWIVAFWAIVSLGAIAVGLNGWWVGPEIEHALGDCEPTLLLIDRPRLARLEGRRPGMPTVVIEEAFDELWEHDLDATLPDIPIDEDDPAVILYTSGTTGRPKGAINTHRNMLAAVSLSFFHGARMAMLTPSPAGTPTTRPLVTYPLFHVSGLHMAAVAYLVGGVGSVWAPGRFDPERVMQLIEEERITHWSYTPTMLHRVITHPALGRYDLSTLRSGGGGGSSFSPALQQRAKEVLPNLRGSMGVGYGQTECAALATLNSGGELNEFPDSAGRPLPTVQIEIRDEDGKPVPEGVEGEIHLRGPMVMPGYWQRPDATAETILPGGWLRTGDIGRMDGGRLYLASRKRDLIIRGGENIYPVEIEQRLEEHPDVAEAAVIPVDDEDLGQEVKAVVVASPGATIDVDDLADFCKQALAHFKVPAYWEVRAEPLPRNASGKVVKQVLLDAEPMQFVEE
ncbi:MAG TPA: class I adenylate-forming enzyme family protein [Acidimicrobiia bacterium]